MTKINDTRILYQGQDIKILHQGIQVYPEIINGLLLDLFPNARVAYSTRKLRTAYTGPAIRVRRDSDNAEQDIGFDGNNNLDTVAMLAFVGAGSGFVVTMYDQSGNNADVSQAAAAAQPRIVNVGVPVSVNGRAIPDYDGIDDNLQAASNFGFVDNLSMFALIQSFEGVTDFPQAISAFLDGANRILIAQGETNGTWTSAFANALILDVGFDTIFSQMTVTGDIGVNSNLYQNSLLLGSSSLSAVPQTINALLTLGSRSDDVRFWDGIIGEVIIYDNSQTANRLAIETNQKNYWQTP